MELSEASKRIKRSLPIDFQSLVQVSMKHKDYLLIVINNLIDIYGDYASPEVNWKYYISSNDYQHNCRKITKLSKIPEITFENIQEMLAEEDAYSEKAGCLLSLREKLTNMEDGEEKDQIILEMGKILGVVPNCEEGLFSWLVNFRRMTNEEKEGYVKKIRTKLKNIEIVVSTLSDFFVDGMVEEYYPAGSVMTQPYRKSFFRGEYAFFGSSKAGMYRNVEGSDIIFASVVGKMRINECCASLDKIDAVNHWGCTDVGYIALAQHYGLRTIMIDITSDLRAALFFACCKMNNDGNWVPLSNEDFKHRSSRKESLGLNSLGNSKYGILFRAPREIIDICLLVEDKDDETIIPVGYQPMMRCAAQSAYMLLAPDPMYDMYKDTRFEKYKFRLSEEISNWIYQEMDCGKKIYPHDDIPDIYPEMAAENKSVVFSERVFADMQKSINQLEMTDDEKTALFSYLSDKGVRSDPNKEVFSEKRLKEINEKYPPEYAEKLINKPTLMRPLLHMPGDTIIESVNGKNSIKNSSD